MDLYFEIVIFNQNASFKMGIFMKRIRGFAKESQRRIFFKNNCKQSKYLVNSGFCVYAVTILIFDIPSISFALPKCEILCLSI